MASYSLIINPALVLQPWDAQATTTPGGTYTPSGDESGVYTSATAPMPVQINALGKRFNTTQPLEFQNPTTLAWVTGTVTSTAGGDEFAATLTGVAAGTYNPGSLKMRVVGFPTVYTNESPVTVTPSSAGALTYYPIPDSAWNDGKYKQPNLDGYIRNAFANATGTTSATQINFVVQGNLTGVQHIGCYVNGVFQLVSVVSDSAQHTVALTNLPAGAKTITPILHDPARPSVGASTQIGDMLLNVQADAPITWQSAVTPVNLFQFVGDSIVGGNVATNVLTQGFVPLIRANFASTTTRVMADSFSGGGIYEVYGGQADKAAYLNRLVSQANGTGQNYLILEYGRNNSDADPDTFAATYGYLVDDYHATRPNDLIVLLTPFPCGDASVEAKLAVLRQKIRDIGAARSFVYNILEGPSLLSASNLSSDGTHPNTAGHAQIAQNFLATYVPGSKSIQPITATQFGPELRITSTNAQGALEYRVGTSGSWVTASSGTAPNVDTLFNVPSGAQTIYARLKASPSTITSVQLTVNPVLLRTNTSVTFCDNAKNPVAPAGSVDGTTWIAADSSPIHGAYSNAQGVSYFINDPRPVVGYRIVAQRFTGAPEIYVVTDETGAAPKVDISTTTDTGTLDVLYTTPVLAAAAHTLRVYIGFSSQLIFVSIELILA